VARFPLPKVRAARKRLALAVAVVRRADRLLLARRPDGGLFGGLWEMPCSASAERLPALLGAPLGDRLGTVERTLTHRDLVLELYEMKSRAALRRVDGYVECRWVSRREARPLGVSAAMQEALDQVWISS
jgi:adenine-specific DNA glycosylase